METNPAAEQQPPVETFSELGLPETLTKAYTELNFIKPTPIQYSSIPQGIKGKSIVAQSKAGTGKTLAFLSIVLMRLTSTEETLQGLILVPTRELALQIYDVASRIIKRLKEKPPIKLGLMIGGIPIEDDRNTLRQKVHIVIGTLGRVYGLVKEKSMKLNDVRIMVLDEADKIITAHGMKDQLRFIYSRIENNLPQVLSFSATYNEGSLGEVKRIVSDYVTVKTIGDENENAGEGTQERTDLNVQTLEQYYCKIVKKEDEKVGINTLKNRQVINILKNVQYQQAIIFYNDKGLGEELESDLREEGINLHFIHGDQTQAERIRIMNKLKLGKVNVILATDLLSRGIDIDHISLVINYDVPRTMETYFHRIGRTGRFGKYGVSIVLLTNNDENFLLNNKDYFVSIKELPEDFGAINEFLARNELEGKLKPLTGPGKEEKKEYSYVPHSIVSEWKSVDHEFYDNTKWKYFEENEIEEEVVQDVPQIVDQDYLERHYHDVDNEWAFLNCQVCYQFLLQSENRLGRKFEILKYFKINAIEEEYEEEVVDNGMVIE